MPGTQENQPSQSAQNVNLHIGTGTKLTQERLKQLLDYDFETGFFKWKKSRGGNKTGDFAGSLDSHGYFQITVNKKPYLASRLVFLWVDGYWPENEIDHIDRIPTNNKRKNLREVSKSCNMRNCRIGKNNKSGIKGVYFSNGHGKWRASISVFCKRYSLGYFSNIKGAVFARWQAEVKYGFPNCISDSTAFLYLKDHGVNLDDKMMAIDEFLKGEKWKP